MSPHKPTKTQGIVRSMGHEMKESPPKVLAKTAAKSGARQAEKQRVAILLSKSREAGARIPEKGERKSSRGSGR